MFISVITLVLSVGAWLEESTATPKNFTYTVLDNNKYKYDQISFTDDRVCSMFNPPIPFQLQYNSLQELTTKWSLLIPPGSGIKRFEERLHITTNACIAFERPQNVATVIGVVMGICGGTLDIIWWYKYCKKRYISRRRVDQLRGVGIQPMAEIEFADEEGKEKRENSADSATV
jgi:hypothetical protein